MSSKKRSRPSDGEEENDISPPPVKRAVTSSTNARAVANFFTPTSQKGPDPVEWRKIDGSLLVAQYVPEGVPASKLKDVEKSNRIVAFDLDSTLIKTLSGNVFSKDANDWQWNHDTVPADLRAIHEEKARIVIFTNQGRLNLIPDPKTKKMDEKRVNDFKTKASAILRRLDLPIVLYAACAADENRKPRTGMWTTMLDDFDLDVGDGPDMATSMFVGDAAGRDGDHGVSDRDFAANIGLPFQTPEEFFHKQKARPFQRPFEPSEFMGDATKVPAFAKTNAQDIVLLCGIPGSGKSTYYWTTLERLGYVRVNQDILKSLKACVGAVEEALSSKKSVAIDATNIDRKTRSGWIDIGKKHDVPVRCVHLKTSNALSEHNNEVRALGGKTMNPEDRSRVPRHVIVTMHKKLEPPTTAEGLQDVLEIPFAFAGSEEQRETWKRYWV